MYCLSVGNRQCIIPANDHGLYFACAPCSRGPLREDRDETELLISTRMHTSDRKKATDSNGNV